MLRSRWLAGAGCLALLCGVAVGRAQTEAGAAGPAPGPEHAALARAAGTWDAVISMHGAPASKGVETNHMLGGLWLVSDFKGEMGGSPFEGHGVFGWDPDKKKYVGSWVDTQSTAISLQDGEMSADGQTLTMWSEMKNPMGSGMVKIKIVDTYTGNDARSFAMKMPLPDGNDIDLVTMEYTRRK